MALRDVWPVQTQSKTPDKKLITKLLLRCNQLYQIIKIDLRQQHDGGGVDANELLPYIVSQFAKSLLLFEFYLLLL